MTLKITNQKVNILSSQIIMAFVGISATLLFFSPKAHAQQKLKVQLLFPLETGSELEALSSVTNQPKIINIQGRNFVIVAEFIDAKVAYRLGKSLQKRLGLPFEISYDSGHPQSNFAWLKEVAAPSKLNDTAKSIQSSNPIAEKKHTLTPKVVKNTTSRGLIHPSTLSLISRTGTPFRPVNLNPSTIHNASSRNSQEFISDLQADALGPPDLRINNNLVEAKLDPVSLLEGPQVTTDFSSSNAIPAQARAAELFNNIPAKAEQASVSNLGSSVPSISSKLGVSNSSAKQESLLLVKLSKQNSPVVVSSQTNAPIQRLQTFQLSKTNKLDESRLRPKISIDSSAQLQNSSLRSANRPALLTALPKADPNLKQQPSLNLAKQINHSSNLALSRVVSFNPFSTKNIKIKPPSDLPLANQGAALKLTKAEKSTNSLQSPSPSSIVQVNSLIPGKEKEYKVRSIPSKDSELPARDRNTHANELPHQKIKNEILDEKFDLLTLKEKAQIDINVANKADFLPDNSLTNSPSKGQSKPIQSPSANLNLVEVSLPSTVLVGLSPAKLSPTHSVQTLDCKLPFSLASQKVNHTQHPILMPLGKITNEPSPHLLSSSSIRNNSESKAFHLQRALAPLPVNIQQRLNPGSAGESPSSVAEIGIHASDLASASSVLTKSVGTDNLTNQVLTIKSLFAVNPELIYLYVLVRKPADLEVLRDHAQIASLNQVDGHLLAQVGIFASSSIGRRLLDYKKEQLSGLGLSLHLVGKQFADTARS